MKRIFTLLTIALGLMLPMQAQYAPISNIVKAKKSIEHKMMRKAPAADITVDDIVGIYEASAKSGFEGKPDEAWTVSITADEADASKVWIQPVCLFSGLAAEYINPVYATLNGNGTLAMPLGQILYEEGAEYQFIIGSSADGRTIDTEGEITMSVVKDEKGVVISFAEETYFGVGNAIGNEWWYQAIYNVTYAKENPVPFVYIYEKSGEFPIRVKASQLYFNEVEGEMCVTNTLNYTNDAISGTYAAYAHSAFEGYPDEEWTVTITRDEADANKVWIQPICMFGGLGAEDINPVYATYDEAKGTLTMPLGQSLYEGQGVNMITGTSVDGSTVDTKGNVVMEIADDVISFANEYIFGVGDGLANEWWYQAILEVTLTKEATFAMPIADIERITREKTATPAGEFTFFNPGAYVWNFNVPVSETETQPFSTKCNLVAEGTFDLSEIYGSEASGMTGIDWSMSGFMADAGLLNVANDNVGAVSYTMEDDDVLYELLSFVDKDADSEYLYSSIGTTTMEDEAGNEFEVELLLGDLSENSIYMLEFFAFSDTEIECDAAQAVFWFIYEGNAYLFTYLYDVTLEPADNGAAAPKRIKAAMGEIPTSIEQCAPLRIGEISLRK